jgi:molecular chaperone HscB
MKNEAKSLHAQLASELASKPEQAALTVRKLSFIDKISADVNVLISKLED